MTETVIIGDSQTRALMDAAKEWTGEPLPAMTLFPLGTAEQFWGPFFSVRPNALVMNPAECARRMKQTLGTNRITNDRLWGFCLGFTAIGFHRYALWENFALYDRQPEGRHVISKAAATRMARGMFEDLLKFFDVLLERGYRFFVISAPPLPQHNPDLQAGDPQLRAVVRADVIHSEELYRGLYAKELTARGIDFILPPDEVKDDEGLLLPEYRHARPEDRHHANIAYARLMLPRVADYVRAHELSAGPERRSSTTVNRSAPPRFYLATADGEPVLRYANGSRGEDNRIALVLGEEHGPTSPWTTLYRGIDLTSVRRFSSLLRTRRNEGRTVVFHFSIRNAAGSVIFEAEKAIRGDEPERWQLDLPALSGRHDVTLANWITSDARQGEPLRAVWGKPVFA